VLFVFVCVLVCACVCVCAYLFLPPLSLPVVYFLIPDKTMTERLVGEGAGVVDAAESTETRDVC